MKNVMLLFCALFFSISAFSINIVILNKIRSGGLFGLYGTVSHEYKGTNNVGGIVYHGFDLKCSGYGVKKCRVSVLSDQNGNPQLNPAQVELITFSLPFLDPMEDEVEDKVSFGDLVGNTSQQIAWDKDNDGQYDSLVTIHIEWNADDTDFNDGSSTTKITEIDYPY